MIMRTTAGGSAASLTEGETTMIAEASYAEDRAPAWLRAGVPLSLLLDLACLEEPGYPVILGQALAREGAAADAA